MEGGPVSRRGDGARILVLALITTTILHGVGSLNRTWATADRIDSDVPIDSLRLDQMPGVGHEFNATGYFHVRSRFVDSIVVKAYYVDMKAELTRLSQVSRVLHARFPETLAVSLPLTIQQAGDVIIHFWIEAWLRWDTAHVPRGGNEIIMLRVPAAGAGQVVDQLWPSAYDSAKLLDARVKPRKSTPHPPDTVQRKK